MSDLRDIVRHIFGRFGRPDSQAPLEASDAHVDLLNQRLGKVERQVLENNARLKLLEAQSNPRGIGRE